MRFTFAFKTDEARRRLKMIAGLYRSAIYGAGLNDRSRMIFGYHPDWLNASRGDYNQFVRAINDLTQLAVAGQTVTRDDMATAIWAVYAPRLSAFIFDEHYDSGDLFRDIESATPGWVDG